MSDYVWFPIFLVRAATLSNDKVGVGRQGLWWLRQVLITAQAVAAAVMDIITDEIMCGRIRSGRVMKPAAARCGAL